MKSTFSCFKQSQINQCKLNNEYCQFEGDFGLSPKFYSKPVTIFLVFFTHKEKKWSHQSKINTHSYDISLEFPYGGVILYMLICPFDTTQSVSSRSFKTITIYLGTKKRNVIWAKYKLSYACTTKIYRTQWTLKHVDS
jgi:hypothetical protein